MNANHRRKINAVLTLIDRRLCLFEGWAGGDACRSVFHIEDNDLSAVLRSQLQHNISRIREELSIIKERFGLEENEQEVSESLWSECSELWATLTEIDSKRLRGYGEVSEETAQEWDPRRRQLENLLLEILDLVHQREKGPTDAESP